ncbi:MAG: RAP domain-containing protein [Rickettsiales endosymbiont of Dermacentor nuttalli]
MQDLNEHFTHSYYVNDIKTYVDFYIPKRSLIIQIDGPSHYYSSSELNSSTELNSHLLKKQGYNIERIGYQDINKCYDLKDMLQRKIKEYDLLLNLRKPFLLIIVLKLNFLSH